MSAFIGMPQSSLGDLKYINRINGSMSRMGLLPSSELHSIY